METFSACVVKFIRSVTSGSACVALCLTLGVAVAAHAQKVTKDIAYASGAEGAQTGDFYRPDGHGPFPVILYIHGGSWRSGSKKDFAKLAGDLAAQGYAGFSIDYDLKPKSFPASWNQAREAVRFLRAHAVQYNIDPQRIVVAGESAGAELAALLALAPQGPASTDSTGAKDDNVAAGVLLNGVYVLDGGHVIERYLGTDCGKSPAICTDASPASHIHANAPPLFVGHGTSDSTVPYAEATSFIAALQQAGDSGTPFVANGGPHSYWKKKEFYAANLAAVEAFLASALPKP